MKYAYKIIKPYFFPLLLMTSIVLGGFAGHFFGQRIQWLKPFGDIFLNLILTMIVPLIFFSVASAVAQAGASGKLGRIAGAMIIVFLFTSLVAAIYAVVIVKMFPPAEGVFLPLANGEKLPTAHLSSQIATIFTVSDFSKLLSHENMLALIVFSLLVGLAVNTQSDVNQRFLGFLQAGEAVFMRVFTLIMYYAPIGFFAYFAVLISELGPKLIQNYLRIGVIYSVAALIYFFVVFSLYSYLAGKQKAVKLFWQNIFMPAATSLATCSSAASIPVNIAATKKMKVSSEICETAVPLGMVIHKDGSVIGGIFKIAFLFSVFHLNFAGANVLLTAIGVALLVGTVMGAIPSGGMLGELLILTAYNFPPSALIAVSAISIIVDPLATMLNVTGNSVSALLIARLVDGKDWFSTPLIRDENADKSAVPIQD